MGCSFTKSSSVRVEQLNEERLGLSSQPVQLKQEPDEQKLEPPPLKQELENQELEKPELEPPHQIMGEFSELEGCFRSDAIRLVKFMWLYDHVVLKEQALLRRQDLPKEAFATAEEANAAMYVKFRVRVVSHAWLARGHPDPHRARTKDIQSMYQFVAKDCSDELPYLLIFWDFLSLHQIPRAPEEESLFREALSSMHLLYSHRNWGVLRLVHVPANSPNNTEYHARGWTFFETAVAAAGAMYNVMLRDGSYDFSSVTPVPLSPATFKERLSQMVFTSKRVDMDIVASLYGRIFPLVSERRKLLAYCWSDTEALEFLAELRHFPLLKAVAIIKSKMSKLSKEKIAQAMDQFGGEAHFYASHAAYKAANSA